MRKLSPFTQDFEALPNSLPVFPLQNAIVLPGGLLPLNIFEPRYLNMFKDAMKSQQLIGMIQPKDDDSPRSLFRIGCAGRIVRYEETVDGRLEVLLVGLCRFVVKEELSSIRGYRLVVPDWEKFQNDYEDNEPSDSQTSLLFNAALRNYFKSREMDVDWKSIEQLSQETLVNNLVGQLPISVADKQLLLEAQTLSHRVKSFIAILDDGSHETAIRH